MKLYCGCISPTERRKRPCEDEERTAEKIQLLIFKLLYFLCCEVICGTEGNLTIELKNRFSIYRKSSYENVMLTDWNSRTEQRERPKRDRLIARDVNGIVIMKIILLTRLNHRTLNAFLK